MFRRDKAISSATAATVIVSIIIVIGVGIYATITYMNNSGSTSITCSENTSSFAVLQNATTEMLSFPIPVPPCQHHFSISGFSLKTSSGTTPIYLTGNITVDSRSAVTGLILYVNGTYEIYNPMAHYPRSKYSIEYYAPLNNSTVPIISGANYSIQFVALFEDGTATTASISVIAT